MTAADILAISPGSTSTKIGVFRGEEPLHVGVIRHTSAELGRFRGIWDQFEYRHSLVRDWARRHAERLDAVAAIGGLFRPLPGGTYGVNEAMLADARGNIRGAHASNLGCALAAAVAEEYAARAFVVDPVSVDEFTPLARYSGHPRIERKSLSHSLNIHAVARRAAADLGIATNTASLVVAHLGGGISVAPVAGGRIVDVNDAASDGPFSPERTGGLPLQDLIGICFSGGLREDEVRSMVMGGGGLVAYLGTNSAVEVEERIAGGDARAREVYEAMAYQIAKEIGAMATVLKRPPDAIVLSGGLAGSALLTGWIRERVGFLARVLVYPGEDELRALAGAAARVLQGRDRLLEY